MDATVTSRGSMVSIFTDHLGMRNTIARRMPPLLTNDLKHNRNNFKEVFGVIDPRSGRNMDSSRHTGDQAAVETENFSSESAPKKTTKGLSLNKVTTTAFWDACGIINIDQLADIGPTYWTYFTRFAE